MSVTDAADAAGGEEPDDDGPAIAALRSSPDRTVFTEEGNADGWIATDHTVDLVE